MIELEFSDLVIRAAEYDAASVAEPWAFRLPFKPFVLTASAMGHVFLEGESGVVWWLDTWSGDLAEVVASVDEYRSILLTQEFIQEWLMPELVGALLDAGIRRTEGQCFSPFVSPGIGGSLSPENFAACPLRLHLITSAEEYRALGQSR